MIYRKGVSSSPVAEGLNTTLKTNQGVQEIVSASSITCLILAANCKTRKLANSSIAGRPFTDNSFETNILCGISKVMQDSKITALK